MNKKLIPAILGGLGILGISSQALAYELFTVDPSAISGSRSPFKADSLIGTSSGLINLDPSTKKATESGYVTFSGFQLAGNNVAAGTSGLGVDYGLYLTFDLTASYIVGSGSGFGTNNSDYKVDILNFTMYADKSSNTSFQQALITGGVGSSAFVIDDATNDDDIEIATGSLKFGQSGIVSGGVTLNSTTDFILNADGESIFTEPKPFHNIMFNAFNNTGDAVAFNFNTTSGCIGSESNPCQVAVKSGGGVFDFRKVPEPATVALLGIGLLGFGTSRLRKKA